MSELKAHKAYNRWIDEEMPTPNDDLICNEVYLKSEADKVIAEKDKTIAELKEKLESVQASMYCDVVDANMENRRLKRALWIARAERAEAEHSHWSTIWFCDTKISLNINKASFSNDPYKSNTFRNAYKWRNMWADTERKCRAKAEEYK